MYSFCIYRIGDIERFIFCMDDKYMAVLMPTGELNLLKVLDPVDPNLAGEICKLSCTSSVPSQLQVCSYFCCGASMKMAHI